MANIKNNKNVNKMNEVEVGLDDFFSLMKEAGSDANLQLPNPNLLQYYYDRNDRIIWIVKDVEDTLFDEIKLILYWNRQDEQNDVPVEKRKPIKIMCHSYGGNLDACFAMIDIMKISKTPIYTYNLNACMSAGAIIYINGHKRFAMPLSTVLLHQGSGGCGGQYEQVLAQTENYKKLISLIQQNILKNTKIPKATLTKKFEKEWYIYIDEQIKYGITDKIITNIEDILQDKILQE